jgi:hypothetical protein
MPSPMTTEQADPGGVTCTIRMPLPGRTSWSRWKPTCSVWKARARSTSDTSTPITSSLGSMNPLPGPNYDAVLFGRTPELVDLPERSAWIAPAAG